MKRLTLDDVREALPDLDELRPIFDHLLARSEPDEARTWSGAGQLDTVGSRMIPAESLSQELEQVAAEEAARIAELYAAVSRALRALGGDDRPAAAAALLEAAALEEGRDRPDRAAAYAEAAHRAVRDEKDQRSAATALRRWGRAARARGMFAEAYAHYAQAHAIGRALSTARAAAEAALGAGNVLLDQGRWTEADEWYRAALEALEGFDGPAPERWQAMLNLHIVARSRGAIEESLPWLERAEEAAGAVDPETAAPFIHNARGQLLMARGAFGEAEAHLRMALEPTTGAHARVTIRLNLAEAMLAQGHTLDAAEQAREGEREAIRAGVAPKLPEVYRLLGRIASADGNADALVFFERALALVRERSLPALEEALTLQAYAESEADRGETDTAQQLQRDAAQHFEALGMTHMRHAWADVYGPRASETPPPPDTPGGDDHDE